MSLSWIVIANGSEAKIYQTQRVKLLDGSENGDNLQLITAMEHPASREKPMDLVADRAGTFESSKHDTFVEQADAKKIERENFAREIVDFLENSRTANKYDDLILIAPAAFRGIIYSIANEQLKNQVSVEVDKDYTKDNPRELVAHLQDYL